MYLCCLCKNTITFIFYSNSCNPKTDHLFLWTVFLDFSTSFYNTVNGKQNCIPKFNFPHIPNLLTLINSFWCRIWCFLEERYLIYFTRGFFTTATFQMHTKFFLSIRPNWLFLINSITLCNSWKPTWCQYSGT